MPTARHAANWRPCGLPRPAHASGQRRPAAVGVAAGGAPRDLRLAVLDTPYAYIAGNPASRRDRAAPASDLAIGARNCRPSRSLAWPPWRIFQRAILGLERACASQRRSRPAPIEPPTRPPCIGRDDRRRDRRRIAGEPFDVSPPAPSSARRLGRAAGSKREQRGDQRHPDCNSDHRISSLRPRPAAATRCHLWLNLGCGASFVPHLRSV